MPNWVKNYVRFSGREEDINKLYDFVGRNKFDFNKIIPMPGRLNIQAPATIEEYMYAINANQEDDLLSVFMQKYGDLALEETSSWAKTARDRMERMSQNEIRDEVRLGKQSLENVRDYGFSNWYDWRCYTWGVKWDVTTDYTNKYSLDNMHIIEYEFNTAWCKPDGIIYKIASMFPGIEMIWAFSYEDEYSGQGYIYKTTGNSNYDTIYIEGSNIDMNTWANMLWSSDTERIINYIETRHKTGGCGEYNSKHVIQEDIKEVEEFLFV